MNLFLKGLCIALLYYYKSYLLNELSLSMFWLCEQWEARSRLRVNVCIGSSEQWLFAHAITSNILIKPLMDWCCYLFTVKPVLNGHSKIDKT